MSSLHYPRHATSPATSMHIKNIVWHMFMNIQFLKNCLDEKLCRIVAKKAGFLEYIKCINIYMKQMLGHIIAGLCMTNHKLLPTTNICHIKFFFVSLIMLHVIGQTVFYDKTSVRCFYGDYPIFTTHCESVKRVFMYL